MRKIPWALIGKVILSILFIGFLATTGFLVYTNRQIISNVITPKPVSFTELYFQNNESLPSKPKVIKDFTAVPYTFSFTIHNLENKDMKYSYTVSISGQSNETIDTKSVFVANGDSKTISETFYLPNQVTTRTKVTVTLANKDQQVFFWMGGGK